jgi:hypothetical protein
MPFPSRLRRIAGHDSWVLAIPLPDPLEVNRPLLRASGLRPHGHMDHGAMADEISVRGNDLLQWRLDRVELDAATKP